MKIGDKLYCHTPVIMSEDGSCWVKSNQAYEIIRVDGSRITIMNSVNYEHNFSQDEYYHSFYEKWFTKLDDTIDTEKLFNELI